MAVLEEEVEEGGGVVPPGRADGLVERLRPAGFAACGVATVAGGLCVLVDTGGFGSAGGLAELDAGRALGLGWAFAAGVRLTPRLLADRREEGCWGVGVAMARRKGIGRKLNRREDAGVGSTVRIPEIDDSSDRQISVDLGVAGGEARRRAAGGEHPVPR